MAYQDIVEQAAPPHHASRHHLIRAGIISFVLLSLAAGAFLYRQQIIDQLTVWSFTPTSALETAASDAGLNDTGKFYLYASQAAIVDRGTFNSTCGSLQSEQSIVLGCYTSPARRIYVYNVTDTRLEGIIATTSAHEMLHAAFDRLSQTEKERVGELLRAEQAKLTDKRLLNLIANYEKTEPGELVNELHSIIATEVRSISPELEGYYSQYFSKRESVVALTERYEKVFTDLADEQERLVTKLDTMAADINKRQEAYTAGIEQLNTDIQAFNKWTRSSSATEDEYNSRRGILEERITTLETERDAINAAITEYNSTKAKLDALNLKAEDLNQSINSKVSPTPSL